MTTSPPVLLKSTFVLLAFSLLLAATPALADPWLEQAKLVASDGAGGDEYGFSVTLEGDTAVVGARLADVDGEDSNGDPIVVEDQGVVYVLARDGETWAEQTRLTASDGASDDWFGSSVALAGNTILVGASQQASGGPGAAYVYVHDGVDWVQQAKVTASDGMNGHQFGFSVALSGDTALVGAPWANMGDAEDVGSAYVFTRGGGGTWSQQAKFVPDDWTFGSACNGGQSCPRFGYSVALWEDTALLGAQRMVVDGVFRAGAAYVYVREAGGWTRQAVLRRPAVASQEFFGTSVALMGDTSLVGANGVTVDGNGTQGTVHVFTRNDDTWSEQQEFTALDGESGDRFGTSVGLLDGVALVGAPFSGLQGAAYRYTRDGGIWTEQQRLEPSDGAANDDFGHSVALSGNTALVGAPRADIGGNTNQGAAYVFDGETSEPNLVFDPVILNFGGVEVGQTSAPQTATLSNTGGSVVTGLTFNTPGSGFDIDHGNCGDTLQAGTDCEVSVTFTPGVAGPADATLTADSDQGASTDLTLTGEGTISLFFSPASLNFGTVVVGTTSAPQMATLSNTGDDDVTGLTLNTPGSGFDIDSSACGADLPAGTDCEVSITFTPAVAGPGGATLTVDSDQDASADLALSGEGVASSPQLSFSPGSLDFGDIEVGTASAPQTATLLNSGGADATGLMFNIPGSGFDVDSSACGDSLPAGGDCDVSVIFMPAATGTANDTLIVEGDDEVSASLGLTGNGTDGDPEPGILSVQPGELDFGIIEAGDTAVMTATVSNAADLGSDSLTLDALDLDGGGMLDPSTSMASLTPDGGQWSGHSKSAHITPDGRYVAYISSTPVNHRVPFRHDLWTGTIEAVSVRHDGDGWASVQEVAIAISPDGRYVAFNHLGAGTPPIPDGPSGFYIRDMDAGVTEFIDIPTTDGELPNGTHAYLSFGADFRVMAFTSNSTNLVSGVEFPDPQVVHLYIYDRDAETVELVSMAFDNDGMAADAETRNPLFTPDGRYVAFLSFATNLVPDDTNGELDAFVHDRVTGITERVSVASDGSEGNAPVNLSEGHLPATSADGRYVSFSSQASNLVPEDTNGFTDVFIRDRVAGTTERVSVASDGFQALGGSSVNPAITPDGRYVVFRSHAANLVPGDTNGWADHFIHDRATGITERVSVTTDGTEGNAHSFDNRPGISADGRFVTFATNASLAPADSNGVVDIYVRDRGGPALVTTFEITGGDCAVGTVLEAGDSCTVEITFSPDSAGAFEDMLNVATNDAQSALVPLHGNGAQGPVLAFSPSSLDFGDVEVGTASAPENATLTNTGDGDATDLGFTQPGSGFDADTSDCGNTLPVGETCQVVVTFTPPQTGSTFAPMDALSAEGETARLTLIGNGVGVPPKPDQIFRDRFETE